MNRTLGFDLGSKTLGVSVSDPLGMIARALTTLRFDSDDYDSALAQAQALIREQHADKVVLGLPRHMNGDIAGRSPSRSRKSWRAPASRSSYGMSG